MSLERESTTEAASLTVGLWWHLPRNKLKPKEILHALIISEAPISYGKTPSKRTPFLTKDKKNTQNEQAGRKGEQRCCANHVTMRLTKQQRAYEAEQRSWLNESVHNVSRNVRWWRELNNNAKYRITFFLPQVLTVSNSEKSMRKISITTWTFANPMTFTKRTLLKF